jgi:hypothetical protein
MADLKGITILGFEIAGIEAPGRVYSHPTNGPGDARYVAFNEPWPERMNKTPDPRWSGLPVMFLYVDGFEAALALAREIGEAHKAGNVDAYVGRWRREQDAAARSSRAGGRR